MKTISVVLPCLNEEATIGKCIEKAKNAFHVHGYQGEIIVGDNGSTDNSVKISESLGAKVVHQSKKGYGNAYHAGIAAASGDYIVLSDADDTYDLSALYEFVKPLDAGYDMVIGNRFSGRIAKQAMPFLNRYVGNPILSGILRFLFKVRVSDAHCGMRSFTREAYKRLKLQTEGMEYASEMIIAAGRERLKIQEIPIRYDVRLGESKLSPFRDGWRHLKLMLILSPSYLFLAPGIFMFLIGAFLVAWLTFEPFTIGSITLNLHPMFFGALLTLLGLQVTFFGIFTRTFGISRGLIQEDKKFLRLVRFLYLEKLLVIGGILFLIGATIGAFIIYHWIRVNFGELFEIRRSVASLVLIMAGIQIIFSGFFLSVLQFEEKTDTP